MKLAGQTLLVDCSYNSVEVSPPTSIHNLSHLKCTMVGEEMQKPEKGVCQGACKTQSSCPIALAVCLTYIRFLPILISLTQGHTVAMLQEHQSVNHAVNKCALIQALFFHV